MEKKSISEYFFFGTSVRYLQDAEVGERIFVKDNDYYIYDNIRICLSEIEGLGLIVTKNAAWELMSFFAELNEIKDKNATLSIEQTAKLKVICTGLRPTLEAELKTHEAYIVTPKRFNTEKLINDIGSLMPPGIFEFLPDEIQYDLMEAGKCIAFERTTAAAFHILRGTEAVLRLFYCTLIHNRRVPNLLWGDITQDLKSRQKTKKHSTLYNNLDNIRHSYRNPTQHPEAIYDIHEAQDLLPLCFEVIGRMVKIIKP